jgi:hypothetical protein
VLSAEPIVGEDRFGQSKAHPAVEIERKASLACVSLLAAIIGKAAATEAIEQDEDFFS